MKKRTLLYIPLVLMSAVILLVMFVHFMNSARIFTLISNEFEFPFFNNGSVRTLTPEAAAAGLELNDRLIGINGRIVRNDWMYLDELSRAQESTPVTLTIERKTADGQAVQFERGVAPVRINKNFTFYAQIFVSVVWNYAIPAFCALLGLWVVWARPRDFLAWLLLFLLLGLSSNSLEGYPRSSLVGMFRNFFFSTWALSMLLFGIYFPERWKIDEKFPWAKWIFIVPLSFQILLTLLGFLKTLFGIPLIDYLEFASKPYDKVAAFINMLAIGMFFASLGHKSGTLENPDARRRLKLTVYGTTVAMLPSFIIVLYAISTGKTGSFFEVGPWWFALLALLVVFLFPLTMAYVIVVQRAMDVSVVVRQGLQYGLAKGGVRVFQFIMLIGIGLGVGWTINRYGQNIAAYVGIIIGGIALLPLIDFVARHLRVWVDRKFFREAYNAEQILSDLSEEVRTMVETKPLLETVSAKISESLHVPQVALLLKNGRDFHPAYALGYENAPSVELSENDKTIEKLKKNEPLVVYQDDKDSWVNEEVEGAEREKLQKLNSQLLLPVGAKNELSGLISLSPKRSEEPYTPNDLRLLKSVAAQTGLALENSRLTEAIASEAAQRERLNREVEIAREVQERLFPQELLPVKGLDYFGACRPALGVGGDYYDFLELEGGKFGIAIGDISGKGIGAALMMASLQASLRGQSIHYKDDLAALMGQINHLLYEASTTNRYATFFYAQFDPATRKLVYVNAGHNPPFLIRKNADESDGFEVLKLEEGGAVVGMLPSMFVNYKQGEVEMQPGDLLVGFTDGISEAMNPREEEWGEDAMLAELKNVYEKPSAEILPYIVSEADRFADGAKQHDDMTMIVVKVIAENE